MPDQRSSSDQAENPAPSTSPFHAKVINLSKMTVAGCNVEALIQWLGKPEHNATYWSAMLGLHIRNNDPRQFEAFARLAAHFVENGQPMLQDNND